MNGFKPCTCGQNWPIHSALDAAAVVGVHRDTFHRLRRAAKVGTLIHGRWHFRRAELKKIRPKQRGGNNKKYSSRKEAQQAWYRKDLEANRAVSRERFAAYYAEYRTTICAKNRLRRQQRRMAA